MASILRTLPGFSQHERDPAQLAQGRVFLHTQRVQPPAGWTGNRFLQAKKYTGTLFLVLSSVVSAMAGACTTCERRKRRDRTTFAGKSTTAVVSGNEGNRSGNDSSHVIQKSHTPHGAGNDEDYAPVQDHPIADVINR